MERSLCERNLQTFAKCMQWEHITTLPYHLWLNGLVEHFKEMFERTLEKYRNELLADIAVIWFLDVCWMTHECNITSGMSLAEWMFTRKVRFDKLLLGRKELKWWETLKIRGNTSRLGRRLFKIFFFKYTELERIVGKKV